MKEFIELYFVCAGFIWIAIGIFFAFANAIVGVDDPLRASQIQRDIARGRASLGKRFLIFFLTLVGIANPLYAITSLVAGLPLAIIVYLFIH